MLPVNYLDHSQAPFNQDYLNKIDSTLNYALQEYPRTLAIRIDLRLPSDFYQNDSITCFPDLSDCLFARFTSSLKAKIRHYRCSLLNPHPCKVRYIWVREIHHSCQPHYHVVLFLNKDLFRGLGHAHSSKRSLWDMIQEAWLSALRIPENVEYLSLVHFPDNSTYILNRNAPDFPEQYRSLVFRVSYMAKESTKVYSPLERSMGSSQK